MSLAAAPLRANVELKARLDRREPAIARAASLGAEDMGEEEQIDTYFATGRERMKIRESSSGAHALIRYSRPDRSDARRSQYRLLPLTEPGALKVSLTKQWGVKAVVRKRRRLFVWNGRVRIHLDQVDGLGDFLEFEAMLDEARPEYDEGAALLEVARLAHDFEIRPEDLIATSYSTLVLEAARVPGGT